MNSCKPARGVSRRNGGDVPLPSDIDLWRSAGLVVRQHGSQAPAAARDRAKRLEASGDKDGAAAWRLIAERCEALLNEEGTRQ